MQTEDRDVFGVCTVCRAQWAERELFLADPRVRLLGFQPGVEGHLDGRLLFNHETCKSTFSISVAKFDGLLNYPRINPSAERVRQTPIFCLGALDHIPCPPFCSCDYVWKMMGIIEDWTKVLA